MKKQYLMWAAVLFCLIIGFMGCPNVVNDSHGNQDTNANDDSDDNLNSSPPGAVTYSGITTDGDSYELAITEKTALYAAATGDSYVLTVILSSGGVKKSQGTVQSVENSLVLKPSNSSGTFTVTVTVNAVTSISISGTITWEDNTTASAPTFRADKTELIAAIAEANAAKAGVVVSTAAGNVPAGVKWVTQEALTAFNTAIGAAETAAVSVSATAAAVNAAVTALQTAITAFNAAKQNGTGTGTLADKTALNTKISAAKTAKAGVSVAENATQLVPGTVWVTGGAMTALNTAISTAEAAAVNVSVDAAAVSAAVTALQTAIETFTAAKQTVTVTKTALNTKISEANTAKTGVTVAASATGLAAGTVWVTSQTMTVFETAISTAQTVYAATGVTQAAVSTAVSTLQAAIETFTAAKQTAGDTSVPGGPPGPGTTITLTNIPAGVTGNVAVVLATDPQTLVAGGLGAISDGSVTVQLKVFNNEGDPFDVSTLSGGAPWTYDDGGSYLIMIAWGSNYRFGAYSSEAISLPANRIIDAANFINNGPSGPQTGGITGSLAITGISSDVTVTEMYMNAYTTGQGSGSTYQILLNPADFSGGSPVNFEIPLYAEDSDLVGQTVHLHIFLYFSDKTSWSLDFNNSGNGWVVSSTAAAISVGALTASIPATKIVTVTGTINPPAGKTIDNIYVQIAGYGSEGTSSWKIRMPADCTSGTSWVSVYTTDGESYSKSMGNWSGATPYNLGTIDLTEADKNS